MSQPTAEDTWTSPRKDAVVAKRADGDSEAPKLLDNPQSGLPFEITASQSSFATFKLDGAEFEEWIGEVVKEGSLDELFEGLVSSHFCCI